MEGPLATNSERRLQLPPPRTLTIARQHAFQTQTPPRPTQPMPRRQARRITIRVDDPNSYVGPFEVAYLQCPNCGGRANVTDAFCGVCGYPLMANTPAQPQPKPIAVWSPRLQRPMPPAHFESPTVQTEVHNSFNRPHRFHQLPNPQMAEAALEDEEIPQAINEMTSPAGSRMRSSAAEMWAQIAVLGMVALICLAGFWLFQVNQTKANAGMSVNPPTKTMKPTAVARSRSKTADITEKTEKAPVKKEAPKLALVVAPVTPTVVIITPTSATTLRPIPTSVAYVVQPGDTCISIASLFSVAIADLIAHNKLDNAACLLRAGSKIYIPTSTAQGAAISSTTASDTPTLAYAEPRLLSPPDNAKAEANLRLMTMTWASSVVLADNEYYVVHIQSAGGIGTAQFRTKLPSLTVRPEMLGTTTGNSFVWWVSLQNVSGQDAASKQLVFRDLSPASEARRFNW